MVNARRIGRLGMLAVGLGIGAAVASTPGIASADPSIDPFTFDFHDFALSIDGYTLFHEGTATATSGFGDFAIADGAHSYASANGGFLDYASADGTNAYAVAGGAAGTTGNNFDSASDIGNNTLGGPGFHDGAFAGAASLIDNTTATGGSGSFNTAIDIGNNGIDPTAEYGLTGGNSGAFAGAGGLIGSGGNGNADEAITFGNLNGFGLGSAAVAGNNDAAFQDGNFTGVNLGSFAGFGNNDLASIFGDNSSAGAGGDYVPNGIATILGNNDIATVFGSGSDAVSGASNTLPGNFDLASVFGDMLHASATGGDYLYDILPGIGAGAADSTSNFLTDILSSFGF